MLFLAEKIYLSEDSRLIDFHSESRGISCIETAANRGNEKALLILAEYLPNENEGEWYRRYNRAKMGYPIAAKENVRYPHVVEI